MAQYDNIFKIKHNGLQPEKGKILISEPFVQNPYFERSVILLIQHDFNGFMGLVLNKRTGLHLNEFFPELKNLFELPIYLGGPVSSNHLFFIHTLGNEIVPYAMKIGNGLYFDGDFEALKEYINKGNSIEGKVKFFLGYSGWGEGQLDDEIKQDSWLVASSSGKKILLTKDESLWKDSLESLGTPYSTWQNYPKDPNLN